MKSTDRVRVVRRALVLVVGISLLGACSDGDGTAADPTVPTAAPTSATSTATTVPDVSSIPAAIDVPYLNAVLAALDEVDGQATRLIYAQKRFTPEAADLLSAIYSDDEADRQANARIAGLVDDPQLASIRPNPGNRKTTVQRLIAVSTDCVWMQVQRDHTANSVAPQPPRIEYLALRPLDRSNDAKGVNPTAWMITAEGFNPDGSQPGAQCASS